MSGETAWESLLTASRVLLVGSFSAALPSLKSGSLTTPAYDPSACEDALHAGASCSVCVSKFKLCRGHFVYEPFTVVLLEAVLTVLVGVIATFAVVPSARKAAHMLLDWRALRRVAPIGATYALADIMDLNAARRCSATTLLVASQMRLPLCALLRSLVLGRRQTLAQWVVLLLISVLCVVHVVSDVAGGDGAAAAARSAGASAAGTAGGGAAALVSSWLAAASDAAAGEGLVVFPLIFGKCLISCAGAVHAEFFLQHKEVQQLPLWVTQVHFKLATVAGTLAVGYFHGRRGGRIMAREWRGDLFTQLPPGTQVGDPRVPFFGGWDGNTWLLVTILCVNNFVVGDQLKRLTSVAKYVAYALGMVFSYFLQLWLGGKAVDLVQALCCANIAVLAVGYVYVPGPRPANAVASTGGKKLD